MAFTYHLLHTFAHAYHLHQRKVVSDNEWAGWLRRKKSSFEQGQIREYWKSNLDLEKWFDSAFSEFIDKENYSEDKFKGLNLLPVLSLFISNKRNPPPYLENAMTIVDDLEQRLGVSTGNPQDEFSSV